MFHPRILRQYTARVVDCQESPVDACADSACYYGVNIHTLAAFLRTIRAHGSHRLNIL
jgi:hypothetical protein